MPFQSRPVRFVCLFLLCLAAGCITHKKTQHTEVARLPVSFENDTAARHFYEALDRFRSSVPDGESRTGFHVPVVFSYDVTTVRGPNAAFNEAVRRCDTNQDGIISALEARIFDESVK